MKIKSGGLPFGCEGAPGCAYSIGWGAAAVGAAMLIGLSASKAWADVPNAQWSGESNVSRAYVGGVCCEVTSVPVAGPGSFPNSTTSHYGATASSTVVTTGMPFPSLFVSAQTSATSSPDFVDALSQVQLTYYIQFDGPASLVTVDLLAAARLSASGEDPSTGSNIQLYLEPVVGETLMAGVNYSSAGVSNCCAADYGVGVQPGFNPASFPIQAMVSVPTYSPIEVLMYASAFAESGQEGPQSASAYLDPYFSIDPSTPNADQYSILISPGIGNAPAGAIPEPSVWAMMLIGFAGLGFAGNRRGRKGIVSRLART